MNLRVNEETFLRLRRRGDKILLTAQFDWKVLLVILGRISVVLLALHPSSWELLARVATSIGWTYTGMTIK